MFGPSSKRLFFALDDYADAKYVIFGAPYDATATFRKGTKFGPSGIREASYNLEMYVFDKKVDLTEVKIHDAGDLPVESLPPEGMIAAVNEFSRKLLADGKFPIMMGGEHSVSPGCATAFEGVSVLGIDAHDDYRDEFEGCKNNHACAMRRMADKFGEENVMWVGVRSFEKGVHSGSGKFIDSLSILDNGIDWTIEKIRKELPCDKLYISLDIDGIDPAYAPGTGTPEPYGLTPLHVKKIIDAFAEKLVGFDLVEVSPPMDNGMTSVLAARIITNVIAARETAIKKTR